MKTRLLLLLFLVGLVGAQIELVNSPSISLSSTDASTTASTTVPFTSSTKSSVSTSNPKGTSTATLETKPIQSTATGSTASPPTTPAHTIHQDVVTFPNSINPPDAKLIMQHAVALTNHVNDLQAQIIACQNEINPNNSQLILDLEIMSNQTVEMNSTLQNITSQLQNANTALTASLETYNDMSRIYTCFANCTTLPPSCGKNYTSTLNVTVSFTVSPLSTIANYSTCTYIATSSKGWISYSIAVNFIGTKNDNVTVTDLNTGIVLGTYNSTNTTGTLNTTTNAISITRSSLNTTGYMMNFTSIDPCGTYSCDNATAQCSLSSLGTPFCVCKASNNTCVSLDISGRSCSGIDPCTTRNVNKCKANNFEYCRANGTQPGCPYTCTNTTPPMTVKSILEKEVEYKSDGFFSRWVF